MAQVSNIDSELSGGDLDGDHAEESKRRSLLHTVKDKAKGTVRKLKHKVKKGSTDSSGLSVGSDDEIEESSSGSQTTGLKVDTRTGSPNEGTQKLNGSEPRESFGGKSDDDILSSFARSGTAENSPLVAVPTSYSDPNTPVDAVMPAPVIAPSPVSNVGEESSTNLGNIPESKEEEKEAAKEVQQDDSDINESRKNTFKQKDLQAIDGLPKPRGFDLLDESSVKSSDLRGLISQVSTDQLQSNSEELVSSGQSDREFPTGDSKPQALEGKPHPAGTAADFQDNMFSSHVVNDLKPNEPAAAEALQGGVVGTFSREGGQSGGKELDSSGQRSDQEFPTGDSKPQALEATPHPTGTTADFHDHMFSSLIMNDLKPKEPAAAEALQGGVVGTFSREGDQSGGQDRKLSRGSEPGTEPAKEEDGNVQQGQPPASTTDLHPDMFASAVSHDLKPSQAQEKDGNGLQQGQPPASTTELHPNMFASADSHDLKPSKTDEPSPATPTAGGGPEDFHEARKDFLPPTPGAEPPDGRKDFESDPVSKSTSSKTPGADKREGESFFDAESDDVTGGSQKKLDPEASAKYGTEGAAATTTPEAESPSSFTSTLKSVVGSVASRFDGSPAPSPQGARES